MKLLLPLLLLLTTLNAPAQLRFDGAFHQNVDHGGFWEPYSPGEPVVQEADFAWEAWVKLSPDITLGYVVSSGYGGAHAMLFGFDLNQGFTQARFVGNFAVLPNGVCGPTPQVVSFGSALVFETNVWYHVAVASVDHVVTMYKDGQPIGTTTWTGSRISHQCNSVDYSAGILYVGGSNHLNFTGEIAQLRGWEGFSPYTGAAFTPQTKFLSYWITDDKTRVESVFLANYSPRKLSIKDESQGYHGVKHDGYPYPTRPLNWRSSVSDTFPFMKHAD